MNPTIHVTERKQQLEQCTIELRLIAVQIQELQAYANAKFNEAAELRGAIRELENLAKEVENAGN
jgi:hypothetical protein